MQKFVHEVLVDFPGIGRGIGVVRLTDCPVMTIVVGGQ